MKKCIVSIFWAVFFPCLLLAQGSNYRFGTTIQIEAGDSLARNVISAGQFINIDGYLGDDLFGAAQIVELKGTVVDDAIVLAEELTVNGSVGDMLLAAGETVVIDGFVEGDLIAAGNEIRLTPNARIGGNAALAAGKVTVEDSNINGWLRVSAGELMLNGTVGNYVELYGDHIRFGNNYRPASSTTITTTRELNREELGSAPEDLNIVVASEEGWVAGVVFSLWLYISLLITGILLMLVFPQTTSDLYRFTSERYFKNTGIGFLLFLGIPLAIIALLIVVLTIPVSFVLMVLYGLALLVSYLLVATILGTILIRIFKSGEKFTDYYWGLAIGMILILVLGVLPYVGWIINLLLIFFGLGTLLSYFWKLRRNTT